MATTSETYRRDPAAGPEHEPHAAPVGDRRDARSMTDLIKELRDETTTLLKQEVALAKTEMSEKASRVGRNMGALATGGALALSGAIVLLFGIGWAVSVALAALGLSESWAAWLGFVIVGAIVAAIGGGLIGKGASTLKRESLVPQRTSESLQEDKQWAQHKIKR